MIPDACGDVKEVIIRDATFDKLGIYDWESKEINGR